ncbi:MAG: hemerythrin domain-containing protein [Candidatus Tectimicrobiota bacterium]
MAQQKHDKTNEAMEEFESPVEMLEADHRKVQALFDQFENAGDAMTKAKRQIIEDVFAALELHTQLEEEIFYPAVKAAGEKEGKKLVAESVEEHQVVKTLIADMRSLDPNDERYAAKFTVLIESVRHHIEEEESEMFPLVEDELADDMESLLEQMVERKHALQAS